MARPAGKGAIPVSLAHVLLDIARAAESTAPAGAPSLLDWAVMLRVVPDEGIAAADLVPAARISRRAAKAWLTAAKREWLTADGDKIVRLTNNGRRARDRWAELVAESDGRWSATVRGSRRLRGALAALVGGLDLEHPHYPMTYGTADWSAIGGSAVKARPGPPRVPAHGTDWVPVLRDGDGGAAGLPLIALASQALMAFTIDYEDRARFPMAVAAILGRAMPSGAAPMGALPRVLAVDGSGKSGLERHGLVRVAAGTAALTEIGVRVRDAYAPVVAEVSRDWTERYGTDVLGALSDVDAQLDERLPDHVLVRHRPGIGFHDVSFHADES
jgi:hypothetical protein